MQLYPSLKQHAAKKATMISRMCDFIRRKHSPGSGAYYKKTRRYLARRELTTLACNYHCRLGEVDLIAMNRQTLVFVEVRYRKTALYGYAVASVIAKKQSKPSLLPNITCKKTSMATECRAD